MAVTHRITPEVLAAAERLGIYGATAETRLLQMAKRAARITHPDATHRFRRYIMVIQPDGTVTMLDRMSIDEEAYYTNRKYKDRKADDEQAPSASGEASVEYTRGPKSRS